MTTNYPLLPDFLIDRLRRRERTVVHDQPRLELPLPPSQVRREVEDDDRDRGVCVIEVANPVVTTDAIIEEAEKLYAFVSKR